MVVGKFTLTGTDNNGFRHRYSVRKNEDFKKAFVKFMVDLGFDEKKIKGSWIVVGEDGETERELKIKEIGDECWNYSNKGYDVDVFYGQFKIIIVVRTKKRFDMVKHLVYEGKWIKPTIVKKVKEKKGLPQIVARARRRE